MPVTTAQVAAAAGVSSATVLRWAKLGVLPSPQIINMGKRGRETRWAAHAPEQAKWVQAQLEARKSWDDIRGALARGEHPGSPS